MKAMVFAAGLGTRLYPLTASKPKALVEVGNITLLERAINKLRKNGAEQILVNVHHFADKMKAFIEERDYFEGTVTISDESEKVLETGGGLKKAAWFFEGGDPFLVYNADIITDFDLSSFYQKHLESGALATLAVRERETSRYLLFDESGQLCGWEHAQKNIIRMARVGHGNLSRKAFSGIHVISPEIFGKMKHEGVFSIIETYLDLASNNKIMAMPHDDSFWLDIGKPESLEKANQLFNQGKLDNL